MALYNSLTGAIFIVCHCYFVYSTIIPVIPCSHIKDHLNYKAQNKIDQEIMFGLADLLRVYLTYKIINSNIKRNPPSVGETNHLLCFGLRSTHQLRCKHQ
ncbi:hypothetical protein BDF20DRAFT_893460 [Mycotypha africana]|uniref:uncharacterized protein n=1 Tax=Mycotypha africana TaxID=64632 RepID=UPI0022FFC80E|nr:uncharacterized protein BDF20DRAFT_893460 [Mycotypha africana]KAI8969148.1 hypothetical protein BDF20DRAFT_893460 [Mycotypha africana]